MRMLVILLVGLLAGCVVYRDGGQQQQSASSPQAAEHQPQLTPWLNPLAQISSIRRVAAPAGMDIRQALYYVEAESESPSVLLRLRDYSTASDGKPDPQRMELLRVADGTSETQVLPDEIAPLDLLVSPDQHAWVLCSVKVAGGASLENAPIILSASAAELSQEEFTAEQRRLPLGFLDPQTLLTRPVKAIQVDNGLPAPSLDWELPAQRYNLKTHLTQDDEAGLFVPSTYGSGLAGYTIDYKPVLPSQANITYDIATTGGQTRHIAQFSYHVSYSAFPWQPPLLWATAGSLATIQFLPDATGISSKPNHNGLFRLVTINTQNGELSLIEDHLPPGVPVGAGDGVLFYTRQQPVGEKMRWELWATGSDGLVKQRLWRPDEDTMYLSVEDVYHGNRLLVHRQYFKLSGQQPQLISELQEFSLNELPGVEIKLGFQPLTPPQPLIPSSDLMQAPAGDGPPPLSMPD